MKISCLFQKIKRLSFFILCCFPLQHICCQAQVGETIYGEPNSDYFGTSTTISHEGNIVAIGALGYDGVGNASGGILCYILIGDEWQPLGDTISGSAGGDNFGESVTISDDGFRVAAGSIRDRTNGWWSGRATIYELQGGQWQQLGNSILGDIAGDYSGRAIELSGNGNRVIVGSHGNDFNGMNAGKAKVFEFNAGSWTQIGSNLYGSNAQDEFGRTVDISYSGDTVAIGSRLSDINGNASGKVEVFCLLNEEWVLVGSPIGGESHSNQFGLTLDLSSDGTWLSSGSWSNNDVASYGGQMRSFHLENNLWVQKGSDINGTLDNQRLGAKVACSSNGIKCIYGNSRSQATIPSSKMIESIEFYQNQWQSNNNPILNNWTDLDMSGNGKHTVLVAEGSGSTQGFAKIFRNCDLNKEQFVWSGTLNSSWDEPQNWINGKLPDSCDDVQINSSNNEPTIDNLMIVINSLIIENNRILNIINNGSLRISN